MSVSKGFINELTFNWSIYNHFVSVKFEIQKVNIDKTLKINFSNCKELMSSTELRSIESKAQRMINLEGYEKLYQKFW